MRVSFDLGDRDCEGLPHCCRCNLMLLFFCRPRQPTNQDHTIRIRIRPIRIKECSPEKAKEEKKNHRQRFVDLSDNNAESKPTTNTKN